MDSKLENTPTSETASINRRDFLHGTVATAAAFAIAPRLPVLTSPKDDVIAKIAGQHEQTVKMLQDWIAFPSIAAENRGYPQGAEYMAKLLRDAGFQRVGRRSDQGQARRLRDATTPARPIRSPSTSCTTSSSSIQRSGARRRSKRASSTSQESAR